MLTCTVSMIETAIAIIAACLPALRQMLIGGSTQGASSYGKHYELGSARRKTADNHLGVSSANKTGSSTATAHSKGHNPNGSEDSLVAAGLSVGLDGRGKIRVDTRIEAMYDDRDDRSKAESSKSVV